MYRRKSKNIVVSYIIPVHMYIIYEEENGAMFSRPPKSHLFFTFQTV